MVSHAESLLFSALSYCLFKEEDIGKNLNELLNDSDDNKVNRDRLLLKSDFFLVFDYSNNWTSIYKNIENLLKSWYVLDIMDKTSLGNSKKKTGFYSIAFCKKNHDSSIERIVISFRGSQLFPLKDAYKDFIETDLLIGLGKKPEQFEQGFEFFQSISNKYKKEIIHLTGHSLGGGIAQYVCVKSSLIGDFKIIPNTVTFNAIGILVDSIVNIWDFFNYDDIKKEILSFKNKSKFSEFQKIMEDIVYKRFKNFSDEKIELSSLDTSKVLKIGLEKQEVIKIIDFFNEDNEKISKILMLIKNFRENKIYLDKVLNFCHSKDFTSTFFPHIGKSIYVDKNLEEKLGILKKTATFSIDIFSKNFMKYHFFDMFIPFIKGKFSEKNLNDIYNFSSQINLFYISSQIRRLIYLEKLSTELIIIYYKQNKKLSDKDYLNLKTIILNDLKKQKDLLFKIEIIETIDDLDLNEFKNLWFEILDRLVSPFEFIDIFDYITFSYNNYLEK